MEFHEKAKTVEEAYERAVHVLRPFDGICPSDCNLCEEREVLMLVPGEERLASKNSVTSRSLFKSLAVASGSSDSACPAQCPCTKACRIYDSRPLDCRSFPVVPVFGGGASRVETYISKSYCPIAHSLPEGFVEAVREAWEILLPFLPLGWRKAYDETPSSR